jgi:hypothetical protein
VPHRGRVVTQTVKFDWLSKRPAPVSAVATGQTLQPARVLGRSSYVCSPAGFGHRSECYAR